MNEEVKNDSSNIFKFDSIVSKLDKNANKQVIIEKAGAEEGTIRKNSIARVLKHKDSPISQTVIIQNTHKAHQAFGVRNAPIKFVAKDTEHIHIDSEMKLINTEFRSAEDLLFSDSKEVETKSSKKRQKQLRSPIENLAPKDKNISRHKQNRASKDVKGFLDIRQYASFTNMDKDNNNIFTFKVENKK